MTLTYIRTVIGGVEVRKGRTVASPPGAPGTLSATPGNAQVSLSWGASLTPGVTYIVKRVNTGAIVATTSSTSATITGLTNGALYHFQVFATNSGGTSTGSNVVDATPTTTPPVTTYFGFNVASSAGDGFAQSLAGRKSFFSNRAPVVRVYGTNGLTATFPVTTTQCPEKRVCWSFKADAASFSETELADGSAFTAMVAWLESIPAGWVVFWVYHHEPNFSGGMEVNPTNYVNTYHQMMQAKNAATLTAGTKVFVTCNFMDYKTVGGLTAVHTASWDDSWVPPRGTHCDIFSFDAYGNPGQLTSTTKVNKYGPASAGVLGTRYDCTYPVPSSRYSNMFDTLQRNGYADSWGILEVNSPLRNWDADESGRASWHTDMISLFMSGGGMTGGTAPKIFLLWEAVSGVKWDQSYGDNVSSASPGGTNAVHPGGTGSPIWAIWATYITAMPTSG